MAVPADIAQKLIAIQNQISDAYSAVASMGGNASFGTMNLPASIASIPVGSGGDSHFKGWFQGIDDARLTVTSLGDWFNLRITTSFPNDIFVLHVNNDQYNQASSYSVAGTYTYDAETSFQKRYSVYRCNSVQGTVITPPVFIGRYNGGGQGYWGCIDASNFMQESFNPGNMYIYWSHMSLEDPFYGFNESEGNTLPSTSSLGPPITYTYDLTRKFSFLYHWECYMHNGTDIVAVGENIPST